VTPEIRDETPADEEAIEALTRAAFLSASHTSHTEQFIVRALRNAGKLAISLVAEVNGVIVGHVAVSPVSISDGASRWFGLGPISVLPSYQGAGIGSALVHQALDLLRKRGAAGCVVLGEPAYYKRFGFTPQSSLILPGVAAKYFQALSFQSELAFGRVSYHEAFSAQG
jgi:putative acetyltransferase